MPLGSEHLEDVLPVRRGARLVLKRDDGDRRRASLHSRDKVLINCRVKLHVVRPGHDLFDVKWIALADRELWAIGGGLIARQGKNAPGLQRAGAAAWCTKATGVASPRRNEVARRMTILSAGSARQLDA